MLLSIFLSSWGGINLEDIKAPECFIIEKELDAMLDIPVFHDDQHGTAIIVAAGLINALHLTDRKAEEVKVVINGAGAAAIACANMITLLGVQSQNIIMCDSRGVIYEGRSESMNQWKAKYATNSKVRTLEQALEGADIFLGLSVKDALSQEFITKMKSKPIIFALSNPDPEITPEKVKEVAPDAIVATGRSDYSNQINNVIGFPYIFRGALDVHATTINDEMKLAAARAIADLARQPVPEEVSDAYLGKLLKYGAEYIVPTPFDMRLMYSVPVALAKAAMESGVARKPIQDMCLYKQELMSRLSHTNHIMNLFFERLREDPKKVIYAEGEDVDVVRTAIQWRDQGYGTPVLVGQEEVVKNILKSMGVNDTSGIEITNAALHPKTDEYIQKLYSKLQRKGFMPRDCARMIKRDRDVFSSMMLQEGEADAMLTGQTRHYLSSLEDISNVIEKQDSKILFGFSVVVTEGRTIFIADTIINELPTAEELVEIAMQSAEEARYLGHEPRIAFLSFSNFGNPMREKASKIRRAVELMEKCDVDFEFDGEMTANVALDSDLLKLYPFSRLTKPANILIMPGLHSANITSKLLQQLGGGTVVGPILGGFKKPVQVMQMGSKVSDILNISAIAAIRGARVLKEDQE